MLLVGSVLLQGEINLSLPPFLELLLINSRSSGHSLFLWNLETNETYILGLLEAVGKESIRIRNDSDMKENELARCSPALSTSKYSPASSSSSHASRRLTPPLLGSRYRAGSDPSISRPDPSSRLDPGGEERAGKSLKLSPRLGQFHVYIMPGSGVTRILLHG